MPSRHPAWPALHATPPPSFKPTSSYCGGKEDSLCTKCSEIHKNKLRQGPPSNTQMAFQMHSHFHLVPKHMTSLLVLGQNGGPICSSEAARRARTDTHTVGCFGHGQCYEAASTQDRPTEGGMVRGSVADARQSHAKGTHDLHQGTGACLPSPTGLAFTTSIIRTATTFSDKNYSEL